MIKRALPLAMFAAIAGCTQNTPPNPAPDPEPKGPATAIDYGGLPASVGKRVQVKAWVLAEGESYRTKAATEEYYLILVPAAQIDWAAMLSDFDETKKLVSDLESDLDQPADASLVQTFNKLTGNAVRHRDAIAAEERAEKTTAWGRFRQNVIGADFGEITDANPVMLRPKRGELRTAALALQNRLDRLLGSVEVEVTGVVETTLDWAGKNTMADRLLKNSITTKQFIVLVDGVKRIRTGREAGEAGGAGLEKSKTLSNEVR